MFDSLHVVTVVAIGIILMVDGLVCDDDIV